MIGRHSALSVLTDPNLRLVDVRGHHERYGGFGFIPGSLHELGRGGSYRRWEQACERVSPQVPVFVCLTEGVSRALVRDLREQGVLDATYLEGGIVRWSAEGLPLAGQIALEHHRERSTVAFRRAMASHFVSEVAGLALERGLDPLSLLRECFTASRTDYERPSPDALPDVIDRAAICCLRLGLSLRRVADDIDHWLALVPPDQGPGRT